MIKSELVSVIAERLSHLPPPDVDLAVETIFQAIIEGLKHGARIEIRGFGSFTVRDRKAREGRNPKSGTKISVPPKRVPFFTAGNDLRRLVNGGEQGEAANETSA